MIADKGYKLANADITIVAQQPKMLPHLDKMRLNLSADMDCNIDQINIKATTTEELGFAGRKEGIACHAVALLVSA